MSYLQLLLRCFARPVAGDKTIDNVPLWEIEPLIVYLDLGGFAPIARPARPRRVHPYDGRY
jgi:hypothetical protein